MLWYYLHEERGARGVVGRGGGRESGINYSRMPSESTEFCWLVNISSILPCTFCSDDAIKCRISSSLQLLGVMWALWSRPRTAEKISPASERRINHAVYSGKGVFMILPTGFGKTIYFEVLPFVFDHKLDVVAGQMRSCIIVVPISIHCSQGGSGQESEAGLCPGCSHLL